MYVIKIYEFDADNRVRCTGLRVSNSFHSAIRLIDWSVPHVWEPDNRGVV